MTKNQEQLKHFIQNLKDCQTCQQIAITENKIVALVHSCESQSFISLVNQVTMQLNDFNFTHVFTNLVSDKEFVNKFYSQLLVYFTEKFRTFSVNCLSEIKSRKKKFLVFRFLFNYKLQNQSNSTFLGKSIETKCRKDLEFCYSFLITLNQTFYELEKQEIQQLNINEVNLLAIRIIKSWDKVPVQLVDEALRFVNFILLPKLIYAEQNKKQARQLLSLIFNNVFKILESNSCKIGSAFSFISFYLDCHQHFKLQLRKQEFQKIIMSTNKQIQAIFPNVLELKENALQNEIEKLKFYAQKGSLEGQNMKDQMAETQAQINNKQVQKNKANRLKQTKLSISLLKGVSSFITSLFLYVAQQRELTKQRSLLDIISSNGTIRNFQKLFYLLTFCNDKTIFQNLLKLLEKKPLILKNLNLQLNIDDEYLMKYIVKNCHQYSLNNFPSNLQKILSTQLLQGKKDQIFALIKEKFQKQYDHAFNSKQFQSAANLLTVVFKIFNKNLSVKDLVSKQQVIEWIKALLNLNESCLPIHRKTIIQKTYRVLSQVYAIILPGNQYLQEVIQNELIINSYPQKVDYLQKLITFYQTYGCRIFEQGYRNKIELKRFTEAFGSLWEMDENKPQIQAEEHKNAENTFQVENNLSNKITSTSFRKYKLLDRMFNKMQSNELSLQERTNLWEFILRVYSIGRKQDLFKDKISNISDLKKMFSQRPDILLARHLVSQNIEQKQHKQILKVEEKELNRIGNHLKEFPFFYQDYLRAFNSLN